LLQSKVSSWTCFIQVRTGGPCSAGWRRLGEVPEEALHALHLFVDEAHVVADAGQLLRLLPEEAQQGADSAEGELSHR
jgi:hypothetical protein